MEAADFSGYATKAGLKCSDGRTITAQAFQHMNGLKVPLVWQHGHGDPENVLGHAILECRHDGVYAHGFFNGSQKAQHVKMLVHNGDVNKMSIYANQLKEHAKQVLHGMIREVSLVIAGANPGAFIDQVRVAHSEDPNDFTELEDEAIIRMGLQIEFAHADDDDEDDEDEVVEHAGQTLQQIYDSMSPEQQDVCNFMVATALDMPSDAATHSDTDNEGKNLEHQEGNADMGATRNVFDQSGGQTDDKHVLSHEAVKGIFADALRMGSMKDAVEAYALKHNIDNIDTLFPDAKMIGDRPDFVKRRTEWVTKVLNGTSKSPFSRIKTMTADLTFDDARAKGYIKGNMKKEEFFAVAKRTTAPTTIYKKQKLDRDDILDITSFDVVAWLKFEMRFMLEEEAARAILISDGRDVSDEDKIKDPAGQQDGIGIRSIYNDDEFYVTTVNVNVLDASSNYNEIVEAVLLARRFYKGTGTPDFFTTEETLTRMLLAKDGQQRRLYNSVSELATAMRVGEIIPVEPMEAIAGLIGIVVNLTDYNVGTDKGGEINFFDDFDIDYNQYKYLMETRFSGALVKHKSALKIMSMASGAALVDPITAPTFVSATGVVTIPTQTGVTYKNADTNATLSAGAQTALAPEATLNVLAVPASASYYFETDAEDEWSFTRPAV